MSTHVQVYGDLHMVRFFDVEKMSQALSSLDLPPGTNWMNQMKTVREALGDSPEYRKMGMFSPSVIGVEKRSADEVAALMKTLLDAGLMLSCALVLEGDEDAATFCLNACDVDAQSV